MGIDSKSLFSRLKRGWGERYKTVVLSGPALILISELFLVISGMSIKQISDQLATSQIVFFRNFFALILLLPWLIGAGYAAIKTKLLHLHLLRSVLGVSAMSCLFYAWGYLPLAQAALLKQTAPFFIPLIAFFWLREAVAKIVLLSIFVGFLGVYFVLNPQQGSINFVVLIAVFGAFIGSFAKVTIRRMSITESPKRIVFYFSFFATLVSALPALFFWQPLNGVLILWLACIAISSTIAQLLISKAFALSKAGILAPMTYVSVLYAALFGWLFWGEVLTLHTLMGIILIGTAGVMTMKSRPT